MSSPQILTIIQAYTLTIYSQYSMYIYIYIYILLCTSLMLLHSGVTQGVCELTPSCPSPHLTITSTEQA